MMNYETIVIAQQHKINKRCGYKFRIIISKEKGLEYTDKLYNTLRPFI